MSTHAYFMNIQGPVLEDEITGEPPVLRAGDHLVWIQTLVDGVVVPDAVNVNGREVIKVRVIRP